MKRFSLPLSYRSGILLQTIYMYISDDIPEFSQSGILWKITIFIDRRRKAIDDLHTNADKKSFERSLQTGSDYRNKNN